MKKRSLTQLSFLIGGACLLLSRPYDASATFESGSGTEADPYLISTPQQLNELRIQVNVNKVDTTGVYYQLSQHLDLAGFDTDTKTDNGNWEVIGTTANPFKGHFDGNSYVIKNSSNLTSGSGLFGFAENATIQNLGLIQVNLKTSAVNSGGLVRSLSGDSLVQNVYVTGTINGSDDSGGLIGLMTGGALLDSYSSVTVSSSGYSAGGLVGQLSGGRIENSYNLGKVSARFTVGGIAGEVLGNSTIDHTYSNAVLSAGGQIGGLMGSAKDATTLSNSYYNNELAKVSAVDSKASTVTVTNVQALTTEQMTGEAAKTFMPAFDFETSWRLYKASPRLLWQQGKNQTIIEGDILPTVVSFTVPTALTFEINPNLAFEEAFVAPDFTLSNDSSAPLMVSLSTFNETTDYLTDVLGDAYPDERWATLGAKESKQIALGLAFVNSEAWLSAPYADILYAKIVQESVSPLTLGIIKPHQEVLVSFKAKHGLSFSEALTPQYQLTFIFDLLV